MGSYNVACGISGLTIDCGEACGYIPLEVKKYPMLTKGNDTLIGCESIYSPATMPIWGEYFDYGYMDIDEKENHPLNLKICRKILGVDDEISIHHIKNKSVETGMFILKSIYDGLIGDNLLCDYNGKVESYDIWGSVAPPVDDSWRLPKVKKRHEEWVESGYEDVPYDASEHTSAARMTLVSNLVWWRDYGPNWFAAYFKFSKDLKKELDRFNDFNTAFYSVNGLYFPTHNGPQHGNHYMQKRLNKMVKKVIKTKLEKS